MEVPNKYTHDLQISPVKLPPNPSYVAALHMSVMAFAIVVSIFVVVFATLSTAYAGAAAESSQSFEQRSGPLGYAAADQEQLLIDFPSTSAIDNIIKSENDPGFQAAMLSKAARAVEMFALAAPKIDKSVSQAINIPSQKQASVATYMTAGLLGLIMMFMVWVTSRMWREIGQRSKI